MCYGRKTVPNNALTARRAAGRAIVTTPMATVVCAPLLTVVLAISLTTKWVRRSDDMAVVYAAHASATRPDQTTVICRVPLGVHQVGNRCRNTPTHKPAFSHAHGSLF